jgi:hypothetical protein
VILEYIAHPCHHASNWHCWTAGRAKLTPEMIDLMKDSCQHVIGSLNCSTSNAVLVSGGVDLHRLITLLFVCSMMLVCQTSHITP